MKKICFFINSDWYFKLHWLERAQVAANAGYEIHVISKFKDAIILTSLRKCGFICHDSGIEELSVNPFHFIKSGFRIYRLVKKINPSLLHCITIKPCLLGGTIARILHIPVIFSIVGLGRIFTEKSVLYRLIFYPVTFLYRFCLKNTLSHVLFEHENDKLQFISILKADPEKCSVIEGAGVEVDEFSYIPEHVHQLKKVLFAGRLLWSKGLADLIEARRELLSRGMNFELIVAGISIPNDPDAISDVQMKQWQSQCDIIWVGQSNNMHNLISESNIIALPTSYPEGIPRILLEAASTGRATICYDSGGCNKLLIDGETGFLVKKNDLKAFTNKLALLLQDDLLRSQMGHKARARVEERFSANIVKRKTLDLYKKFLT